MLLNDSVERLLRASAAAGSADATLDGYNRHLTPLRRFFGDVDVKCITTDDLRRYVIHLQSRRQLYLSHRYREPVERPLSRHTVNTLLRACRRLFSFLHEEGIIENNPAARLTISTPPDRPVKALQDRDLKAMIAATAGSDPIDVRDHAIVLFLADTGCRRGGLANLTLSSLQLDDQLAQVHEKGGRSRKVFFGAATAHALKSWLAVRPDSEYEEVLLTLGNGPIRPLGVEGISRVCKRLKIAAGVNGPASPHAFRHRFAREFLREGGDIGVLAQLMGHADIAVTLKHYAQFIPDELQAFHRQFSSLSDLLPGNEFVVEKSEPESS